MAPEPTWQGLPTKFKENVVHTLDFASRHNLSLCSKSDHSLVEATPLFLNNILIYLWTPPQYDFIINIIDNTGRRFKFTNVSKLAQLFANQESRFKTVTFSMYLDEEDECEKLQNIVDIFENLKFEKRIQIARFGWNCNSSLNGALFKIFENFQPREVVPFDCALSTKEVHKLVKLENFKKGVKKFETFVESEYDVVKDFDDVDQLLVRIPKIQTGEVWKVIKHYQSKIKKFNSKTEPEASFNITTTDEFPLEQFLEQLDAPTKNPEWDSNYPEYTQILPTSSEAYHLKVEVGRFSVRGVYVCSNEN